MNREIKFRAWDKNAERMLSWEELKDNQELGFFFEGERFFVLQYTGLKDKHGKDVFEGDIIQKEARWVTPKLVKYEVVFDCGGFFGDCIGKYEVLGKGERHITLQPDDWDDIEIIGNIYENGDLLK